MKRSSWERAKRTAAQERRNNLQWPSYLWRMMIRGRCLNLRNLSKPIITTYTSYYGPLQIHTCNKNENNINNNAKAIDWINLPMYLTDWSLILMKERKLMRRYWKNMPRNIRIHLKMQERAIVLLGNTWGC